MKTIRLFFALFFSFAVTGLIASGSSYKTETRNVSNYTAIKVSTGIGLYVKMGTSEEVKIIADNNEIDNIITEVKNGTLHIYSKKSTGWLNWNSFSKNRKAYVTIKELNEIEASSGSDVKSENTLSGESLKVRASSGSDINIAVIYRNLSVDTSSGSDVKISGKVKSFEAKASSGSDINAHGLESKTCKVNVSSGSDAQVNVTDEIHANASSGSDVYYYGNPQIKNINESSGGNVRHR